MNRFTTAAVVLLIIAASVFAAGGAIKPVTATEKGIETRSRGLTRQTPRRRRRQSRPRATEAKRDFTRRSRTQRPRTPMRP